VLQEPLLLEQYMSKQKEKETEYATIQIRRDVKEQVVDFCNRKGLKIGRFIENLFIQAVSGSTK
jgi:hypothetical protein